MAKITVSYLRDLENQCDKGEISFSRMVELLNERAADDDNQADRIERLQKSASMSKVPLSGLHRLIEQRSELTRYMLSGWHSDEENANSEYLLNQINDQIKQLLAL